MSNGSEHPGGAAVRVSKDASIKLASDLTTTQELVRPRQTLTAPVSILIWRMRSSAQKPETGRVFQVCLRNEDGR